MFNTALHTSTILFACCALASCGSSTTPTPPSAVSLIGTVTARRGARPSGTTRRIADGSSPAATPTTNNDGMYRFYGLAVSTGNVSAVADGYDSVITSIYIDGTQALNFTLRTSVPWSKAGTGNAVFGIPTYITRVHVLGVYTG